MDLIEGNSQKSLNQGKIYPTQNGSENDHIYLKIKDNVTVYFLSEHDIFSNIYNFEEFGFTHIYSYQLSNKLDTYLNYNPRFKDNIISFNFIVNKSIQKNRYIYQENRGNFMFKRLTNDLATMTDFQESSENRVKKLTSSFPI